MHCPKYFNQSSSYKYPLPESPWPEKEAMKRTLLLKLTVLTLLGAITCSSASDDLVNASKLQMFMDELPDMPRILGYEVVHGVPRSRPLQIGMFTKFWVMLHFCFCFQLCWNESELLLASFFRWRVSCTEIDFLI